MSVNIFKNGILSKIAGAVGDAVPLINNFLTNQAGKGAADANTVYVLNNKIDELNSSLDKINTYVDDEGKLHFVDATGADTVLPFSNNGTYGSFTFDSSGNITIPTTQEPTEVIALFKSNSSSTYNFTAYYNKNHTSMNAGVTVSGNSFSINKNNSGAFGGSTGEYIWR